MRTCLPGFKWVLPGFKDVLKSSKVPCLPAGCADHICCCPHSMMPDAHCESEDKENTPRNVRPATPAKKFEQKDSENEKLRRENEELRSELEKTKTKLAAAETVRAAAISESGWQPAGHKTIGQLVRRFFDGHPSADGVVSKWRPATEDGAVQFRVVHDDDGDEEDLDEDELEAAIAAYVFGPFDPGLSVNPPSAITVQFPFETSRRRGAAMKLLPCTATLCESATERVGEYVLLYGKQHGHAPERRRVVFCTGGQLWDEELGQCLEWQMTPAPAPAPVPGANKDKPARRRAPPKDPDFVEEKVRAPNPSPGSGPDPEPDPDPGRRFGSRRCGAGRAAARTRSRPCLSTLSSSS